MNILQVCPRYPPQTGGVETHVRMISEHLVKRGHQVTVHTADGRKRGERVAVRNGVEVRRHKGVAPGGTMHLAPGIIRSVHQSSADVIHAHNYHSFPLVLAGLGVTDGRYIVTPHYHGGSAIPIMDRLHVVFRPIGGWALSRADRIIAVSEWEREQLYADFGSEAIVIPNGVEIELFQTAAPETRSRPYLLSVGRLVRYKGVQHEIRVLPKLREYELVVVGDGPYLSELKQLVRSEGVEDRVTFLSNVDDERLRSLYAGATAVLNLSTHEAYGLTVAEALASGTPCVVRDAGALTEWANTPGVVVIDEMGPTAIRDAVKTVVAQEPLKVELPTWDMITERLEGVYRG